VQEYFARNAQIQNSAKCGSNPLRSQRVQERESSREIVREIFKGNKVLKVSRVIDKDPFKREQDYFGSSDLGKVHEF
jgi:hypothetical protein